MFSFYTAVKNKFRGDYGAEKSQKEIAENRANEEGAKTPVKPDHAIVDIEEEQDPVKLSTGDTKPESSNSLPSHEDKKGGKKAFTTDDVVQKRKILKPTKTRTNRLKEREASPDWFKELKTGPDSPTILTVEEFADISGVRTKIEKRIRKKYIEGGSFNFPHEEGVSPQGDLMQREVIQDICKEESLELFNSYKVHYENYVKRCRQYNFKPVPMDKAIGTFDFLKTEYSFLRAAENENVKTPTHLVGLDIEREMTEIPQHYSHTRRRPPTPPQEILSPHSSNYQQTVDVWQLPLGKTKVLPHDNQSLNAPDISHGKSGNTLQRSTVEKDSSLPPQKGKAVYSAQFDFESRNTSPGSTLNLVTTSPPQTRTFAPKSPDIEATKKSMMQVAAVRASSPSAMEKSINVSALSPSANAQAFPKSSSSVGQENNTLSIASSTQAYQPKSNAGKNTFLPNNPNYAPKNIMENNSYSEHSNESHKQYETLKGSSSSNGENNSKSACVGLQQQKQESCALASKKPSLPKDLSSFAQSNLQAQDGLSIITKAEKQRLQAEKVWKNMSERLLNIIEVDEKRLTARKYPASPPPPGRGRKHLDVIVPPKQELPKRNIFVQSLIPHLDSVKEPERLNKKQQAKFEKQCKSRGRRGAMKVGNEYVFIDNYDDDDDDVKEIKSLQMGNEGNSNNLNSQRNEKVAHKETEANSKQGDDQKEKVNDESNEKERVLSAEKIEDEIFVRAEKLNQIDQEHYFQKEIENNLILENIRREMREMQQMMSTFSVHNAFYRDPSSLLWLKDFTAFTEELKPYPSTEEVPPAQNIKKVVKQTEPEENIVYKDKYSKTEESSQETKASEKEDEQPPTFIGAAGYSTKPLNIKKYEPFKDKRLPTGPEQTKEPSGIAGYSTKPSNNHKEESTIEVLPNSSNQHTPDNYHDKEKLTSLVLEDGPMILYVTASDKDGSSNSCKKASAKENKRSDSKQNDITPKKSKKKEKKDTSESFFKDLLLQLPTIENKKKYVELRDKIIEMYAALKPADPVLPIGAKLEGNANLAKAAKNINNMAKVLFCSIDVRRCLDDHLFPESTNSSRSKRSGVQAILKKSCKGLNERFKGNTSPLSFNDEQIQELSKKGIIEPKLQSFDTSCASVYKCQGGRIMVLLNFVEHVRVIASSRKGDLKRMFSEILFILTSIEENLEPKQSEFLRDEVLGYVNPTIIGNAFCCSIEVVFECIDKCDRVQDFLTENGFNIGTITYSKKLKKNIYRIDNKNQFGISEVEVLKKFHYLVYLLYEIDGRIDAGEDYEDLLSHSL